MKVIVNTCVLPRAKFETARVYIEKYGNDLGFELLSMFDIEGFEDNLKKNLSLFETRAVGFHEPVWGVEHSAPKGSAAYEDGMYHIKLTKKYADILKPKYMVYHLNNCVVPQDMKVQMLKTSLENLDEMREIFSDVTLLVENVGIDSAKNKLLDQDEFTDLCKAKKFDVLIDVGHANANSWDMMKLIEDLKTQIRAFHLHNNDGVHDLHNRLEDGTINFEELMPFIKSKVPHANWIIEYTRPIYHGQPLMEDIEMLMSYKADR